MGTKGVRGRCAISQVGGGEGAGAPGSSPAGPARAHFPPPHDSSLKSTGNSESPLLSECVRFTAKVLSRENCGSGALGAATDLIYPLAGCDVST